MGKLIQEAEPFEKGLKKDLLEKYGKPEEVDRGGVTAPTGNFIIAPENMDRFQEELIPLLKEETDLDTENIYGKFSEEDLGVIPMESDPEKVQGQIQLFFNLRNLIRD